MSLCGISINSKMKMKSWVRTYWISVTILLTRRFWNISTIFKMASMLKMRQLLSQCLLRLDSYLRLSRLRLRTQIILCFCCARGLVSTSLSIIQTRSSSMRRLKTLISLGSHFFQRSSLCLNLTWNFLRQNCNRMVMGRPIIKIMNSWRKLPAEIWTALSSLMIEDRHHVMVETASRTYRVK